MSGASQRTWDALEDEWRAHHAYTYKRTDLVALLREADRHVSGFIREHPELAASVQASANWKAVEKSHDNNRNGDGDGGGGESECEHSRGKRPRRDERDSHTSTGIPTVAIETSHNAYSAPHHMSEQEECTAYAELCERRNEVPFGDLYRRLVKIQAPMVRFSRPPFRKLCRLWGVDISYTHMMLAESCISAPGARHADFGIYADEDRLVVQLAAKSGPAAAQAARLLLPYCDAFDLNCGCPQRWAMKEGLGSALLEKPEQVADMVKCIRNAIEGFSFPYSAATRAKEGSKHHEDSQIASPQASHSNNSGMSEASCVVKMRVNDDIRKSVDFARQVAAAGAGWVTVHGRTPADGPTAQVRYEAIKLIKEELAKCGVPVVANGGITDPSSAALTAVAAEVGGVMCANGLLDNPAAFYLPSDGQAILDDFSFSPMPQPQSSSAGAWEHSDVEAERRPFSLSAYRCTAWRSDERGKERAPTAQETHRRLSLLTTVKPQCNSSTSKPTSLTAFRPLWSLPTTPLEAVSDFLRLSVQMDMAAVTTVQQAIRLSRGYLAPTERVQLSYLKSNVAVLDYFDSLGLYTDRGRCPLLIHKED